ncbi:MAG: 3-keto-disaccharide hydrolase [Opitutaceae bacterium]
MKPKKLTSSIFWLLVGASAASAAFPLGDPPDANHPWGVHDSNRPQPPIVQPGEKFGDAPSDAVILFDGTEASFDNWRHVKPEGKRKGDWTVSEGALLCAPGAGYIETKEHFGDCQLHVEWMAPPVIESKTGQQRGNSGVFLLGEIEVQVLDNYNNPTYSDGTAGAVYGVMPPAANALRGAGQWQSYDIIFRRPIVKDGVTLDEGSMTVLVNGVVVQASSPLDGGGGWKKRKPLNHAYAEAGPLSLQDHGNPVRYRNIWYRPLRPRAVDGGTEGRLSEEATQAQRAETAANIRARGDALQGYDKMMNLLEAFVYDNSDEVLAEVNDLVGKYIPHVQKMSDAQLKQKQWEIVNLYNHLGYLEHHGLISKGYGPLQELKAIADAHGWLKKKR